MSRVFLGIDGGQSSTVALIGDASGAIVGFGEGGPSNHVGAEEGRARLTSAIEQCLGAALARGGLDRHGVRFESACLGFTAGPADKESILRELIPAERLHVTDDATIALSGALGGEPGVMTIAGTGSISFGRNARGETARAGGWGYLFGDEGGAFDLTRRALRAALRFEEGWGPSTTLHLRLREATGFSSIRDVQRRFYTTEFPRHRIAGYAPLVTAAAHEGDAVAREILEAAATDLAQLTTVVCDRLFERDTVTPVSYQGGVFESDMLLAAFTARVESGGRRAVRRPLFGSAAGALVEAYRAAGVSFALRNLPEGY
ncbi:MAG: BadF/BadG/BcrA/BcrD ATPase family protein [Vicinamibacterales bacterium]